MALLTNRESLRVQSFNSGQFSGFEPTSVPDNSASELNNILISKLGQAEQRSGLLKRGDNPTTLISHWTFDASSSVDDVGSNDGTDTDVSYVDGKFGKAASFNATTSKIVVSADTSIDANSVGTFGLSAQIFVDSDGENDVGRIFAKWSGANVGYRLCVHSESSSTVKVSWEVGYATTNALIISTTTISTGAWHRIVAVSNADKSLDLYFDGAIATYATDTTGSGTVGDDSSVDLTIGNETAAAAKTFDGEIDDVRFYNSARTDAEIDLSRTWGLTRFRVPGTIDRVYRVRSDSLERLDDDFKGWTVIDSGFTTDTETNFVVGRASDGTYRLFIGNGTENVHSMTTGEAITDEGNTNTDPPRTSQFDWHDNRLFAINSNGDINFSDILDGQTFDRNTNIFRTKNPAKAVKSFKEKELIIYLTKGIQVLSTSGATPLTDWALTIINEDVEFNSPRSVVNVGNDQIFLAKDGVRVLSRTTFDKIQTGLISQPIQDIIRSINQDAIDKACAWFVNNRYILAIPTDSNTENDTVLIWDALAAKISGDLQNGWTVIPSGTWTPAVFAEMEFSDGNIDLVMGDNRTLSLVYQALNLKTDNGETIVSIVTGMDHTIENATDGIWDPVQTTAHSGTSSTIEVFIEVDRKGFSSLGTIDISENVPNLPIALPFALGSSARARKLFRSKLIGRGRTCRIRMKHNTYNESPVFVEYTLWVRPLRVRF